MENGRSEANKPEWKSIPLMESNKPVKKKGTQHWLDVGMNVLFNHQVGMLSKIFHRYTNLSTCCNGS